MKRRNLFITASLSILLGLGVAAGAATMANAKPAEKVEATDIATTVQIGTRLWFRKTAAFNDGSAKLYYNYNDSSNTDKWYWGEITNYETTMGSEDLYYHDMLCTPSTFQIQRRGPDGSSVWATWQPGKSLKNNLMQVTNTNCDVQGASVVEFYFKTPTNGSVSLTAYDSGDTNKGSITTNTLKFIYSDWHVTYNATGSTGYSLSTWTYSSSQSGTYVAWESGGTTNPTTVNPVGNTYHSATFAAATYTITYDRNLNDGGTQATQTKYYGTSVNLYTPGTSPLNVERWNPSFAKRFLYWNTDWSDKTSTGRKNAGATYSANAGVTYYYIETWYQYRYKVNSGSWIDLVQNDEGKSSGIKVQFAPSSAHILPLNGILHLQYSSNGGSTWSDIDSVTFEGNYDTTTGIKLETNDTLYLKINDSNQYVCWVPGISDRTIAVFNSSSATTGGTAYTMRGDGNDQTVTTMDVPIKKGQFVRRGSFGNYTYGSYFAGGTGDAADCFSQVGSETAVECIKTGVYTVYNKKGEYNNWNDIWFTRNDEASASLLAQIFNEIIGPVCTAAGGGSALSALQAVWGSVSSTQLYYHFDGQFEDTMAYFSTSTATSDEDILACLSTYDYIERKYGTTALPDFLGRNNSYPTAIRNPLTGIFGQTGNNLNAVIAIVAITSVTALSVGGYFFLRKKKEK